MDSVPRPPGKNLAPRTLCGFFETLSRETCWAMLCLGFRLWTSDPWRLWDHRWLLFSATVPGDSLQQSQETSSLCARRGALLLFPWDHQGALGSRDSCISQLQMRRLRLRGWRKLFKIVVFSNWQSLRANPRLSVRGPTPSCSPNEMLHVSQQGWKTAPSSCKIQGVPWPTVPGT